MGSNNAIIMQEAVDHGLLTETEAELMLINGKEIPLHTYSGWIERKFQVKQGEKAIIRTRLWTKDSQGDYHLIPAGLFSDSQVEKIKEEKDNV